MGTSAIGPHVSIEHAREDAGKKIIASARKSWQDIVYSFVTGRREDVMKLMQGALAVALTVWAIPALAEDVKLGAVYSIEGIFSAVGGPERDGAQLAVEQLNQAGGVGGKHINLTIYDDGGDQAKAVQLANRLIFQDKVSAAFGPTVTPTGEMIAPIYEQNKILEIGVIAQDYLWKDTQYIFMSIPTDAVLVEAMLNQARKTGAKKIAIAYADVPYGVSGAKLMRQGAKNADVEIVGETKWGESDIDFTPAANQLHAAKADAILAWGSCAIADAQIVKALRDTGDKTPIIGNICFALPTIAQVAGKSAEGTISFSLIDYSHPSAPAAAFLAAFSAKYKHGASPFAAAAYDGVQLWSHAVARAGGKTDSTSVAAAMIGVDYDGVIGHFKVTKDNHTGLDTSAYKVIVLKNGNWTTY
jgi:branched-chain amino acid transport system substrate-binding protein